MVDPGCFLGRLGVIYVKCRAFPLQRRTLGGIPAQAESLAAALKTAHLYADDLIYIGKMEYPGSSAEIADLLLQLHEVRWVICTGVHKGNNP